MTVEMPTYTAVYSWTDKGWNVAKRLSNGSKRTIARSMSEATAYKVAKLLNEDEERSR